MTDDELRALVRDAVRRHLGQTAAAPVPVLSHAVAAPPASWANHPSHFQYLAVINTTDACVIEPAVNCDHCGYCKSHGH